MNEWISCCLVASPSKDIIFSDKDKLPTGNKALELLCFLLKWFSDLILLGTDLYHVTSIFNVNWTKRKALIDYHIFIDFREWDQPIRKKWIYSKRNETEKTNHDLSDFKVTKNLLYVNLICTHDNDEYILILTCTQLLNKGIVLLFWFLYWRLRTGSRKRKRKIHLTLSDESN